MTTALKAGGALVGREFLFNYFYINGLIGSEQPTLDCRDYSKTLLEINGLIGLEWPAYRRDHPRIIGFTGNLQLNRIGMASILQGPSER